MIYCEKKRILPYSGLKLGIKQGIVWYGKKRNGPACPAEALRLLYLRYVAELGRNARNYGGNSEK